MELCFYVTFNTIRVVSIIDIVILIIDTMMLMTDTTINGIRMELMHTKKYIGSTEVLDHNLNERVPTMCIEIDGVSDFRRLWLKNLVAQVVESLGNQQLRFACWLIDHASDDGKLTMTQQEMSEQSGISIATTKRTMSALQSGDQPFLLLLSAGTYMINSKFCWQRPHGNAMAIYFRWSDPVPEMTEMPESNAASTPANVGMFDQICGVLRRAMNCIRVKFRQRQ